MLSGHSKLKDLNNIKKWGCLVKFNISIFYEFVENISVSTY